MAVLTLGAVAGTRTLRFRDLLSLIPAPALLLIALSIVYAAVNFVLFAPGSGWGNPIVRDGRYFFYNHGVVREVSEDQFRWQRSVELRSYSGTWANTYLCSAVLLLGARRKAKTSA